MPEGQGKKQKNNIKMKSIIKLAALAIMFFVVGNLSAQNNMTDVVYCKTELLFAALLSNKFRAYLSKSRHLTAVYSSIKWKR